MIRARFLRREFLTPDIVTFWFEPEDPIGFLAGQYIELFLPHEAADERGQARWFTISNSPQDKRLGLTMRLEAKSSSFKLHLKNLKAGAYVEFGEVLGDFVVPKNRQVPLVFVAGGIGITPFASMVKDLSEKHDQRTIELHYAVRSSQEILFQDIFEAYGLVPHITVGHHLTGKDILQPNMQSHPLYFLAGSQPMVLGLQKELLAAGVSPMHIALDYFPGYLET